MQNDYSNVLRITVTVVGHTT